MKRTVGASLLRHDINCDTSERLVRLENAGFLTFFLKDGFADGESFFLYGLNVLRFDPAFTRSRGRDRYGLRIIFPGFSKQIPLGVP